MTDKTTSLPTSRLFTVEHVMKELSISRGTLYRLIAERRLRTIKIGKARRISREALDDFIAQAEAESVQTAA